MSCLFGSLHREHLSACFTVGSMEETVMELEKLESGGEYDQDVNQAIISRWDSLRVMSPCSHQDLA